MNNIDCLCFGGEDWWYHNRGHIDMQLMRRFAKIGTTLYINSIVMQKPSLKQKTVLLQKIICKTKSIFTGLKKSDAGFWVYSPFSLPVQHLSWAKPFNESLLKSQIQLVSKKLHMNNPLIWIACPTACEIALKIRTNKLVYQRTDRFEDTFGVDVESIKSIDQQLKKEADLTIFVNKVLYEEESVQCKKAIYLDHGVDYELFASAESVNDIPSDIVNIKKPIVGYFGGLADHKLDVDLLKKLIKLLPEFSFVFVGNAPQEYCDIFCDENMWMLGQKPYEQIPHYGKCFDVSILPWKTNRWTEAANPIKLKEYLALGKPIVSTFAFTELEEYLDVVYVAERPKDFARCIEMAMAEDNPERIAARRNKVKQASWDSKAQIVLDELFTNNDKIGSINE